MSDTPQTDGAAPGDAANAPSLRVLAQYLKDQSFENPKAPQSFIDSNETPAVDVNVDVGGRGIGAEQYEVELTVSVRATRNGGVVFVCETTYAGVFEIRNVPQEQLEPIMLVECPRLLFPFIRQIIAETTTNGNFPPVMLDPIDFFAIYQQRRAQAGQQTANA